MAVLVFASAGELDVILPILKISAIENYRLIVLNRSVRSKINSDSFYCSVVGDKMQDVSIDFSKNKLRRWLQFFANSIRVVSKLRACDVVFMEYGRAGREKNVVVLLQIMTGRAKKIVYHPHGHAITDDFDYATRNQPSITRLSVRFGARMLKLNAVAPTSEFLPFYYPILHPVWRRFVEDNVSGLYKDHVVILSRDIHPVYLLKENRDRMFDDVIGVVRKYFPTSTIVIKAHPRESLTSESFSKDKSDVVVTQQNTYSVVHGARLAISFWTSAFFQCMALNVPVVEYHISHDRFRKKYPAGSLNRDFLPCFSTAAQLEEYIRKMPGVTD